MMNPKSHAFPQLQVNTPSAFLVELIREGSNYELEWLWAADEVSDPAEKRYCLERALYINPGNRTTRLALAALTRRPEPTRKPLTVYLIRMLLLGFRR
jgi:hypothetical protein